MIVKVTQFIAPHGEQRERFVEVPNDCMVGYEALQRKGCRLTAEVLSTGRISLTIEHEEGDFDIEITSNGLTVQKTLVAMIRRFDEAKFERWLAGMNEGVGLNADK